jgi:hypothetical protein
VMYEGRFMGIVPTARATMEDIGLMMAGSMPEGAEQAAGSPGGGTRDEPPRTGAGGEGEE